MYVCHCPPQRCVCPMSYSCSGHKHGHGCEGPFQDAQVERLSNGNVVTPSSKRNVLILKEQCLNINVLVEI